MRQALILSFLLSAPGLAPANAASAEDGAAYFRQACWRCHRSVAELLAPLAPEDSAQIDSFLARHHAPDPELRAMLVAWLLSQTSE